MKILRAIVVKFGNRPDKCSLVTEYKSPFPTVDPLGTLWLDFTCEAGTGLDYITRNFTIEGEIEVIERPTYKSNFSKKV